jgi:uncharacterized FAD-dependent dehydrogenase
MNREKEYTKNFTTKIRSRGWKFSKSSRDEDMHDHVDCHIGIVDMGKVVKNLKIELKGKKYNCRANEGKEECLCQYIEFLNVNGDNGWVFGKADYIAIEGDDEFYMIARTDLIDFCEKLFQISLRGTTKEIEDSLLALKQKWVPSSKQAHHRLYRRFGRLDIVTRISMEDVKSLSQFTL